MVTDMFLLDAWGGAWKARTKLFSHGSVNSRPSAPLLPLPMFVYLETLMPLLPLGPSLLCSALSSARFDACQDPSLAVRREAVAALGDVPLL